MKINLKDKRVIAGIVCAILVVPLGVFGFVSAKEANEIENNLVGVTSSERFIREEVVERNEQILQLKNDILKYNNDKTILENINKETEELKSLPEFADDTKDLNERIEMINSSNKDVNKLLEDLSKKEEIKKDNKFTKNLDFIEELDATIDSNIKNINKDEIKELNDRINKFPGKKYAEKENIITVKNITN